MKFSVWLVGRGCRRLIIAMIVAVLVVSDLPVTNRSFARDAVPFARLDAQFKKSIQPLLGRYCLGCHSTKKKVGELDLEQFATFAAVRKGTKSWLKVVEMIDNGEMPPKKSAQPTATQRKTLRNWVERYLFAEALARAGDPGPVVLRRLNNAEYTYTIRDLTGVDLDPAREFPSEGAGGEGFTNTGNSLVMSPALLRKYLDAGHKIAGHAVLLPTRIDFSPGNSRRDWTDEWLEKIRAFYRQHTTVKRLGTPYKGYERMAHLGNAGLLPLEKYLAATLAERKSLAQGSKAIATVAARRGLNAKYLGLLWSRLNADDRSLLLDDLRARWRTAKPQDAAKLASHVIAWHRGLWTFSSIGLLGRKGSRSRWLEKVSPLLAEQELRLKIPVVKPDPKDKPKTKPPKDQPAKPVVISLVATDAGDGNQHDVVIWQKPRLVVKGKPDLLLRDALKSAGSEQASHFGKHPDGTAIDESSLCVRAPSRFTVRLPLKIAGGRELVTTATLHPKTGNEGSVQVDLVAGSPKLTPGLRPSQVKVTLSRVNIGADERVVSYRNPILVAPKSKARCRFEAALADHRRLFPAALCYSQIVPVDEPLTLTLFYREDDHLARLMLDKSQQAQLDQLWDELRCVSREPFRMVDVLDSLLETTIDHPQEGVFEGLEKTFKKRAAAFRQSLVKSEPVHLNALIPLAARAWRRPLAATEEADLRGLYRRLRTLGLPHEKAFRMTLARVLVASSFLYRLEESPAGKKYAAVTDWELSNRLSYFLWSSMPDAALRRAAVAGSLTDGQGGVEELLGQTRRMLRDDRVKRLATEFACQWIHVQDFSLEQKSGKHFPEFRGLRGDMHEEAIRFFTDLFQHDRSLLSLLDADHTFVNDRLGQFYGIPNVKEKQWRRVDGMRQRGRGGILGFASTLAKQSGASRTSPILRGNWVSEVLLGEKLPRPPKNVPQLDDEVPKGLTERQLIERHSKDPACAKCHSRIDPFGFALEHFDAIGRHRQKSGEGVAIDTKTTLPDGTQIDGLAGLRDYLLERRRDQFLRQFCRKLLGYALGRELQLSDRPLVDEMLGRLAKTGFRFSVAVETIVLSQQFRMIRATPATVAR